MPTPAQPAPLPLFNWMVNRSTGVLLHPTSLPGNQGIGVFDGSVIRFLDFLEAASVRSWQICPLGPTGYGDSPYQCFSAFAGNPYLIDLQQLVDKGLLTAEEIKPLAALPRDKVDYGQLYMTKWPILKKAYERYLEQGKPTIGSEGFDAFRAARAQWLDAFGYFRALKDHYKGKPWWEWPTAQRNFASASRASLRSDLSHEIEAHQFYQYVFFAQWTEVRKEAKKRGIRIIGDVPIFVAGDSADAWQHPELFELDKDGLPLAVAGVPPDYFSEDGQLWGNPLYHWEKHKEDGYAWWLHRMGASFEMCDVVRIDHFRGFDAYWRIPYPAVTARVGTWSPGPGLDFFRAVQAQYPDAKIIAEDLGVLTPSVIKLREDTGLPGMAILQFAFGGGNDNAYLPHNLVQNSVVYPGTHDNDTSVGWYQHTDDKTKDHVRTYYRIDGKEIGWDLIRSSYQATAKMAVISFQDFLSLGSEARFNSPGKAEGNWQWRYTDEQLQLLTKNGSAAYLASLADLYGRFPTSKLPT